VVLQARRELEWPSLRAGPFFLLWLIGIPLPIIILLALFWR
jgi:hypothetical protein